MRKTIDYKSRRKNNMVNVVGMAHRGNFIMDYSVSKVIVSGVTNFKKVL